MSDEELGHEAHWMYNTYFREVDPFKDMPQELVLDRIVTILRLMLVEHLEVPYIAYYKKEEWLQFGEYKIGPRFLWDVLDYHMKWLYLNARKERLKELYEKVEVWL